MSEEAQIVIEVFLLDLNDNDLDANEMQRSSNVQVKRERNLK